MIKKVLKIIGYLFGLSVFIFIVTIGFTQSKFFKDRLRENILLNVSENIEGSLYLSTISGNFITGFSIDSLAITHGDGVFLSVGKIKLHHDPYTILGKKITLRSLTVEHPQVNILKSKDGKWNISKIFRSKEKAPSKFDWTIAFENVKIINGTFFVYDSLREVFKHHIDTTTSYLDYRHLTVNNFSTEISGVFKHNNIKLKIKDLNGYLPSTSFNLSSLSGDIVLNEENIEVKNLVVASKNSNIKIDANLKDVNIFDKLFLADFEKKPVSLKVTGSVVCLNELKSFLPPVFFLNGSVYVDLDAKGEFGELFVNHLNVQTFNSSLKIEGNLSNLHKPNDLFLNFKIDDARIKPSDVNQLLPYFNIPQFKNINNTLIFANYVGNPLDFKTQLNIQTDAGKAQAEVKLNLKDSLLRYSGNFKTFGLNIAKLLDDETYNSDLYSSGTIDGIGSSINNLDAQFNLKIDSSKFAKVKLDNSNLAIHVHDKRIDIVSLLKSDRMKSYITANLDYTNTHLPSYNIEASVTSLNLANFLNDKDYESDLSLQASVMLAGTNINNANATANLTIFPSVVGKHKFQTEEFLLTLNQSDNSNKILTIESSIADILLNGDIDFPKIPSIFAGIVSNFSKAITQRTSRSESLYVENKSHVEQNDESPYWFTYDIRSKNITSISNIINKTPFNFEGTIKGSVVKNGGGIKNIGNIEIKDFFIGSAGRGILMSDGTIKYSIDSLTESKLFEKLNLNVSTELQKKVFNNIDLNNLKFNLDFSRTKGKLIFDSNIGTANRLSFSSEVNTHFDSFEFLFPTLNLAWGEFSWEGSEAFAVSINPEELRLKNFILHRNNKEKIFIDGKLLADGMININGRIEKFDLEGLHHFIKSENLKNPKNRVYGKVNSEMRFSGSLENPVLSMTLNVDSIFYRNSNFGELKSSFNYMNKNLDVNIKFGSAGLESHPDFIISGKLPIDLSFKEENQLSPDEPLDLKIVSSGFQLSVLNPLIHAIDDLQGKLICDMKITGTPKQPNYSGKIQLQQSRFLLLENNIYYNLSGSLLSDVDKIHLSQIQLSNDKSDYSEGKVNINGFFALRDYKISDFDLNTTGQLLLLKETSRKKMQNMYGRLVGMVGNEGLHFRGSLTKSNISGNVIVQDANIVFPPSQSINYNESGGIVRYVAVDDTTKLNKQVDLKHQFYSAMNDTNKKYLAEEIQTESKFLAGLTYDVTLETRGTTSIRMIFNPATSEELYAELDGKINLQRVGNRNYSIGEISVSERSYYNFFKRFEAAGNLKFLGDPNNPELDIKATYSGLRKPPTITPDSVVAEQKVTITLTISGTRLEPQLSMNISIDNEEYSKVIQGGDLQSDAISFLFTNKFRDDLNAREKSDIVSSLSSTAGTSIVAGATSTLLSGILTDFLRREFEFIRSAEITYHGGSIQQSADLRLSGQIFNAYWRFGGRIFDDINNANISFSLNFGDILESDRMKKLFLQLERKVDTGEYTIDKKLTNSARIYYKWSF